MPRGQFAHWIAKAPIGVVAALGSLLFVFVGCPGARQRPAGGPTELYAAGVRVAPLAAQLGHGPGHTGRAGDWLVASDRLRLVVGAARGNAESLRVAGTLLDLATADKPDDRLEQLRVGLQIAGVDRPLQVVSVAPVSIDTRPALRIVQRDLRENLEVETDVRLGAGQPYLELVTRVTNRGSSGVAAVRVSDQLRWLGDPAFAPGFGYVGQALRCTRRVVGLRRAVGGVRADRPARAVRCRVSDDRARSARTDGLEPAFDAHATGHAGTSAEFDRDLGRARNRCRARVDARRTCDWVHRGTDRADAAMGQDRGARHAGRDSARRGGEARRSLPAAAARSDLSSSGW